MGLQAERLIAGMVEANATVIFDSTLISSDNISYDNTTGIITIPEAGKYEFSWWVTTQSSTSTIGAGFALTSSQGDIIIGNSPIKTGEVVGIAVIDVSIAPVTVELKNNSSAPIYYSTTVPVKASLAVIKVDNTATQLPYMAATWRTTQTSILPGEGLLFDLIAQAENKVVMSDESGGYTLFTATENGIYEFDFGVQIGNVYNGTATFYFDLRSNNATLLNRISQSVTGPYGTLSFSKVLNLQSGDGLYLRFSGANGNDTQGASFSMSITIKQLEAL